MKAGTKFSPAEGRAHLSTDLRREFEENEYNGCVGTALVSETDRVRVWHLHIPVGTRVGVHRHVLNYFWTCHAGGKSRVYYGDGRIVDQIIVRGETKHIDFTAGEFLLHSVENVGDTDLLYTTVEFLDSPNPPLSVAAAPRIPR
jgi:hypothetical protein